MKMSATFHKKVLYVAHELFIKGLQALTEKKTTESIDNDVLAVLYFNDPIPEHARYKFKITIWFLLFKPKWNNFIYTLEWYEMLTFSLLIIHRVYINYIPPYPIYNQTIFTYIKWLLVHDRFNIYNKTPSSTPGHAAEALLHYIGHNKLKKAFKFLMSHNDIIGDKNESSAMLMNLICTQSVDLEYCFCLLFILKSLGEVSLNIPLLYKNINIYLEWAELSFNKKNKQKNHIFNLLSSNSSLNSQDRAHVCHWGCSTMLRYVKKYKYNKFIKFFHGTKQSVHFDRSRAHTASKIIKENCLLQTDII